jgi:hypothetical protein
MLIKKIFGNEYCKTEADSYPAAIGLLVRPAALTLQLPGPQAMKL